MPVIMVTLGYPVAHLQPTEKFDSNILVHNEAYEELPIDVLQQAWKRKYASWKMKPNERLLTRIEQTCADKFGKEYASKGISRIIENNLIDAYSFWYGYYYADTSGVDSIDVFIDYLKKKKLL